MKNFITMLILSFLAVCVLYYVNNDDDELNFATESLVIRENTVFNVYDSRIIASVISMEPESLIIFHKPCEMSTMLLENINDTSYESIRKIEIDNGINVVINADQIRGNFLIIISKDKPNLPTSVTVYYQNMAGSTIAIDQNPGDKVRLMQNLNRRVYKQ